MVDVLTGIGNASGLHGFAVGLKVLTKFSCFAERQMATNPYLALLRNFAEDLDKQIKENVLLGTSVNMKLRASNEKFSQKTKNALKTLERKFEKSEALDELTDGGRVSLADAVERKPLDMTTAAGVSGRNFNLREGLWTCPPSRGYVAPGTRTERFSRTSPTVASIIGVGSMTGTGAVTEIRTPPN